jgi:hypothetical protein
MTSQFAPRLSACDEVDFQDVRHSRAYYTGSQILRFGQVVQPEDLVQPEDFHKICAKGLIFSAFSNERSFARPYNKSIANLEPFGSIPIGKEVKNQATKQPEISAKLSFKRICFDNSLSPDR